VERCLACEAVDNSGPFAIMPTGLLESSPVSVGDSELHDKEHRCDEFPPARHGLASEAAFHGWRPLTAPSH
jgi:hypothetical protein